MLFRRRNRAPKRRRIRKLRFLTLVAVLGFVAVVSFAYGLVSAIASDVAALEPSTSKRPQQLGYIYASDGKTVLATLRGDESRIVVQSDQIAPIMKQAIVAVEDRRFWEHRGVDYRGILRAVWADLRNKEVVQGGSTITQQFVKNTYTQQERTISRKLKEAALAWQLERRWSKDRILTAYLNTIYFGNGAYGIEMAARVYFHEHASALTLPQAALLAGLPASPGAYDPAANPNAAEARRHTVLQLMLEEGLITAEEELAADRKPMPDPDAIELPSRSGRQGYFAEYVKQQLLPYYGSGKVFGGGLKVYTTIDLNLQHLAAEAIDQWLPDRHGPAASLVAIDPRDGRVLAMVGGRSYRKSQFNLAVQGERQPGSSFKPFVLATALDEGISPQTHFTSEPTVINLGDKLWSVHNYENSYLGSIDLVAATTYSDNSVFAQLTAQVGPGHVASMAHRLGIQSRLDDYFAIGLGAEAVNPLEMARAFSTFADNGVRVDGSILGNVPRAVTKVVEGSKVDKNQPVERRVMDANDAAELTSILQNVVSDGTGQRAALSDRPVAGKTGTTENYGDAWFVGYTPQLAVAVWVGYPNKLVPMLTEFEGSAVAGGTFPALIWKTFVEKALRAESAPPESFPAPVYESTVARDVVYRGNQWLLDNGNCRDVHLVTYVAGAEPTKEAPCKPNEVDVPTVVGARLRDARIRLEGMPLTVEVVKQPAIGGEELGHVVAQYPSKGTLSSFDTVRVVIPVAENGRIPDVTGMRLARAKAVLARRNLAGLVQSYIEGRPGRVLQQFPSAGLASVRNMTIKLVIGR
ncbi:MAG TPA: PBP1A family penicillin-binding protein [Gaiellaceae bacterium]|nr:PBP1A family penicillin-binding protein [Gaiellaceae bacterium]